MNDFETGTLIASLAVMIWYHFYLYRRVFQYHSNEVQLSMNIQLAERWVMKHKEKSGAPSATLAIQTLRNSIMVGVFIGGNVLSLGINTANEFNDYDNKDGRMKARTCVLAACCICSFLCWVNVIRYCAHLGYLIGTLSFNPPPTSVPPASVPPIPAVPTSSLDEKASPSSTIDKPVTPTPDVSSEPHEDHHHKKFLEDTEKQFTVAVLIARYLMISFR